MDKKALVAKFTTAIERAFSRKLEQSDDQVDFNDKYQHSFKSEYDTAVKIILSVKDADVLVDLMNTYLSLYGRYSSNPNNIHFYRSDQVFELLVEQSAKVSDEIFETWDRILTGDLETDSSNSYKKRFGDLSAYSKSQINDFRKKEREKRRGRRSIIDLLKDEYVRQFWRRPTTNEELYGFDPRPQSAKSPLDNQIAAVMKIWNISKGELPKDEDDDKTLLDKSLSSFRDFVQSQANKDVLSLFQTIKRLQGMLSDKSDEYERVLRNGLYAIACIRLMAVAQADKRFARNRNGFTPEETHYFYAPVERTGFQYKSNIQKVLTSPFKGPEILMGEIEDLLSTYALTINQSKDFELARLDKTLEIQEKWRDVRDITDLIQLAVSRSDIARLNEIFSDPRNKRAIANLTKIGSTEHKTNNPDLGKATLRAGSAVGSHEKYGEIAVVYLEPADPTQIYIEFSRLRPQLFLTHPAYVDRKFYGGKIFEIYRNTIGIVHITEAIFMAMGFMPVLIESGFAGLIYEIALFYGSSKLEEQVAKINPIFGQILGFMIQALAPRPRFKPRIKVEIPERADNTGLSNVLNPRGKDKLVLDRSVNPENRGVGAGALGRGDVLNFTREDEALLGGSVHPENRGMGGAGRGPDKSGPSLPGPFEDFPFGGGQAPLPVPDSPNKVYRIMGMDEAAQSLKNRKLPPPIGGAEGERFVSLDIDYPMLFREKEIADLEKKFGKAVEQDAKSMEMLENRIAEVKAAGGNTAELSARANKLRASIESKGVANRAKADPVIKQWYEAPGQKVVVEIELEPGALDDMLNRSVESKDYPKYHGADVYLWKLERGYGRNIGIPKWQLDAFNSRIKNIRFYAERGVKLLGDRKLPTGIN